MEPTTTTETSEPRRRGRRVLLGVAAVAGVTVVILVGLWITRDEARPVTLDEARERASTSAPSDTAAAGSRPAEGVYEYRGSGTESLSVPPLSQEEGPTIPGTVTHLDAECWRFRLDYSSHHWQTWTYCDRDGDMIEDGGQTWQQWDIGATTITNLSDFTCGDGAPALPAERTEGQEWPARCVGTNDQVEGETVSAGPYRYVGSETLDIGGTPVQAAHFLNLRTVTGAQTGTQRIDVWFDENTGLPLRDERRIEVSSDTPIGSSSYLEEGSFNLVSPTPGS